MESLTETHPLVFLLHKIFPDEAEEKIRYAGWVSPAPAKVGHARSTMKDNPRVTRKPGFFEYWR